MCKSFLILVGFLALVLLVTENSWAQLIITPPPSTIHLNRQGQVFVPTEIMTNDLEPDFYPVTVNNRHMLCYPKNPPGIAGVQPTELSISLGGRVQKMECYLADPIR